MIIKFMKLHSAKLPLPNINHSTQALVESKVIPGMSVKNGVVDWAFPKLKLERQNNLIHLIEATADIGR